MNKPLRNTLRENDLYKYSTYYDYTSVAVLSLKPNICTTN